MGYDKEKLKKRQNDLLKLIKSWESFAKENKIVYSLGCANLIGAIRHKGFIPWDDGIDLYMTYREFKKLKSINTDKKNFKLDFVNFKNKISVGNDLWINSLNDSDISIGVYVLYSFSKNKTLSVIQYNLLLTSILIDASKNYNLYSSSLIKKLILGSFKLLNPTFKYFNLTKKYTNLLDKRYGSFDNHVHRQLKIKNYQFLNSDDVNNIMYVNYEDTKLPIYKNYDLILKNIYGDYMKMPKKERRLPPNGNCMGKK